MLTGQAKKDFRVPDIGLCRYSEAEGLTLVDNVKIGKPFLAQKRGLISDLRGFKNLSENEGVKIGKTGYTYLIHCTGTPYYKIGHSKNMPLSRLADLQTGCPYPLELVAMSRTEDCIGFERLIQYTHEPLHERGEWYEFRPADLEPIIEIMEKRNQEKVE